VAISLIERRLQYETTVVDLQDKPEAFKSLYAAACGDPTMSAKVPILQTDDDTTLIESMVIVEYLDDLSAPGGYSAEEKARARMWATLVPNWLSWFSILRTDAGSEEEEQAVAKVRDGLRAMDAFLKAGGGGGPFVLGDEFSSAEAATAPFISRLMLVLPGLRPELVPTRWLEEDGLTHCAAWAEAVVHRQSVSDTLPAAGELQQSYQKMMERFKSMAAA